MRIMDIIFYFGVTTDLLILVKRDLKTLGGDFIPFLISHASKFELKPVPVFVTAVCHERESCLRF